jgi:hypothetical protein
MRPAATTARLARRFLSIKPLRAGTLRATNIEGKETVSAAAAILPVMPAPQNSIHFNQSFAERLSKLLYKLEYSIHALTADEQLELKKRVANEPKENLSKLHQSMQKIFDKFTKRQKPWVFVARKHLDLVKELLDDIAQRQQTAALDNVISSVKSVYK